MALISGFQYDVFISYSHEDDAPATGRVSWFDAFHQLLEIKLRQRLGPEVRIWRDPALDGGQIFDRGIDDALGQSAILLALVSRNYLSSDYCAKERGRFCDLANEHPFTLVVGDRPRILHGLLTNIPSDELPPEFRRMLGCRLHDDPSGGAFAEATRIDAPEFDAQVRKLADSIMRTLSACRDASSASNQAAHNQAPQGSTEPAPVVFIGDVSECLKNVQRRVEHELGKRGIRVASGLPPPYDVEGHSEAVRAKLADSMLAVHLLDQHEGPVLDDGSGIGFRQRQVELGIELGTPQYVWEPATVRSEQVENAAYREFLTKLEQRGLDAPALELVRGVATTSANTIAENILDKVERCKAEQRPEPRAARGHAALVHTHRKDWGYAFDIIKFLEGKNIRTLITPDDEGPRRLRQRLVEQLREVDLLVIVYGEVDEGWVRERLGDAFKTIITNRYSLDQYGIFLAPPPPKPSEGRHFEQGGLKVGLIDNQSAEELNPAVFESFLQEIGYGVA